MATLNFSTEGIEEMKSFDAIPAGTYLAEITQTEMKATKAGTGEYLQVTLVVVDGEYKGRNLWSRLNLSNPNKTAEEIAARELAAICRAVGLEGIGESEELHGKLLVLAVGVERNTNNGTDTNRVTGYSAADLAKPAAGKPAAGKPATSGKPWAR